MASKKVSAKRTRPAAGRARPPAKRTRRKERPRPAVKAELPEPIATFVF